MNERRKGSELGYLPKSKTASFGNFFFFFFFFTQNHVPAEIGRNRPERPKRAETPRNLARGGTRGFPVPVFMPARKFRPFRPERNGINNNETNMLNIYKMKETREKHI